MMKTPNRYLVPLMVVMCLMFIWNISRNFNDVLIPHLKRACELTDFQSSLIQSAFFGAYFICAVPVGLFIRRYGYKSGMTTGLLIAAMGALLFIPAASYRYYPVFLTALFIMAAGFTFLEVTATPYISVLGDPEKASSRLSLAAAVGSMGATLGPWLAAAFLLQANDIPASEISGFSPTQLENYLGAEARLVMMPYLVLGLVLLLLGILLIGIKLPSLQDPGEDLIRFSSIFKFRHTVLGAVGVFCYLGAEVGVVSFMIRYAQSLDIEGLGEQRAANFISLYMGLVLIGRLSGAYILQKLNPLKILMMAAIGAICLLIFSFYSDGILSLYFLSFIGLFTSIMYPVIYAMSIKNLKQYTKTGSSLIIMSIVGGAIIPPVMGLISDGYGIRIAFLLPVLCYGYVLYYGFRGHRIVDATMSS
jgi:FHS family L-fucose permease-like MFS transporter